MKGVACETNTVTMPGLLAHAKRSVLLSFFHHSHLGALETNNKRFRLCVNHSFLYIG